MNAPSSNGQTIDHPQEHEGPVQALLRLAETARLLRSTDGGFHARVAVGARPEVYAIRSAQFHDWLLDGYRRACQEVPSDWAMRRVLGALEATARFEGGTASIFLNDWSGTSPELLAQLNTLVERKVTALRQWPKSPSALTRELRRIAPQLRLHSISVVFERNSAQRLITLTKTNRPENMPSRLSNNLIGRCFADTFEEQPFDPSPPADPGISPAFPPCPETVLS